MSESFIPPFKDIVQSIPGVFGIRLEEEPAYDAIETVGKVEIRRYHSALLARITLQGDHASAVNEAFTKLAGYIYGRNSADEKLSMTSPVYQKLHDTGASGMAVHNRADGEGWTVAFFLSNTMLPDEAPTPTDPAVELVTEPETVVGSLRFSGNNTEERRAAARSELLGALADHPRWRVADDVSWAQYDQPFAVPFLKRNEAHVALHPRGEG